MRALTLDEALLVLTTKLHYLPDTLTLALDIYLHIPAAHMRAPSPAPAAPKLVASAASSQRFWTTF